MSTWLKLLPLELSDVKDVVEPEDEPARNEKVVGQMSELDKKMFTLGRRLSHRGKQLELDSHYCAGAEEKLELESKAREYVAKSMALAAIMWIGIRDEFGLWGVSEIGVRAGFKVVISPNSEDNNIPPFLKGLFG